MPDTSKGTKNPKDSSTAANTNNDECSDVRPESTAKSSHRARNITIGVIIAVVVVAIVVCILVLAHPWESNDIGEELRNGSLVDGNDDAGASIESEYGLSGRDSSFLAPDDSSLLYFEPEQIDMGNGSTYSKGIVVVYFYKETGEQRAREIVDELNCTWYRGYVGNDEVVARVLVPDGASEADYAATFEKLPEVKYAWLNISSPGILEESYLSDNEVAEFGIFIASEEQQFHLYAARFQKAWETVKCEGTVTVAVLDTGKPKKALSDIGLYERHLR